MTSPPGADAAAGLSRLSDDERAALAAWADEGDVPDGFAERVAAAWLAERLGEAPDDEQADEDEAVTAGPRAATRGGRGVRVVGLVATLAAAAAVMCMVRLPPRASEVEGAVAAEPVEDAEAGACDRAAPGAGPVRAEAPAAVPAEVEPAEPDLAVLGAGAGAVLAQHCMPCHDSTDPAAKPDALQVFDLEQPQWWLTMSDAQLVEARTRVQELAAATDDERWRLAAFVEDQLHRRAHAG
jgi:hypothetical protein